jgi:hypothetical protein
MAAIEYSHFILIRKLNTKPNSAHKIQSKSLHGMVYIDEFINSNKGLFHRPEEGIYEVFIE